MPKIARFLLSISSIIFIFHGFSPSTLAQEIGPNDLNTLGKKHEKQFRSQIETLRQDFEETLTLTSKSFAEPA